MSLSPRQQHLIARQSLTISDEWRRLAFLAAVSDRLANMRDVSDADVRHCVAAELVRLHEREAA